MTHWYTADTHFGHENVIALCGRPFRNAGHMDTVLIENLWSKVRPEDDLWITVELPPENRTVTEATI